MNDCEKCRDFDWCSGEELDSEVCPMCGAREPGFEEVKDDE